MGQNMRVGYARTSTRDQQAGFEAQLRGLKAAGCEKLFREQVSSVEKLEQLEVALEFVRDGDVLCVTRLDRLARSTQHLLEIVERQTQGRKSSNPWSRHRHEHRDGAIDLYDHRGNSFIRARDDAQVVKLEAEILGAVASDDAGRHVAWWAWPVQGTPALVWPSDRRDDLRQDTRKAQKAYIYQKAYVYKGRRWWAL
jgi:hypothetical protein